MATRVAGYGQGRRIPHNICGIFGKPIGYFRDMWYRDASKSAWIEAITHLEMDADLAKVIERVGPCVLQARKDYFVVLCLAIFNQQIALKTAETLFKRFSANFPSRRPTPASVVAYINSADEATLRHCGLSRQKRAYILDLAGHFLSGKINTRKLRGMTDDEVAEALMSVKGIGRWTAEMFLIFSLNRPDVFPVDDLGLRRAMKGLILSRDYPSTTRMLRRAKAWQPWRTIATWYLWRGLEPIG